MANPILNEKVFDKAAAEHRAVGLADHPADNFTRRRINQRKRS